MITRKDITSRIGAPDYEEVDRYGISEQARWSFSDKHIFRYYDEDGVLTLHSGRSFERLKTLAELDEFLNAVEWPLVDTEDADASPDDDTALIITALQMEIDRLRDGGKPELYWEDADAVTPQTTHHPHLARKRCDKAIGDWREIAQRDGEWPQEVRDVRWGIRVDVERAREFPTSPYCPEYEESSVDYEIAEAWRPGERVEEALCEICAEDHWCLKKERPF